MQRSSRPVQDAKQEGDVMVGRGRNGVFVPRKVLVMDFPTDAGVFVYSRTEGKEAPIVMRGSRQELQYLFGKIYEVLAMLESGGIVRVPISGSPRLLKERLQKVGLRKIRFWKKGH